jgi:hypothetical protein
MKRVGLIGLAGLVFPGKYSAAATLPPPPAPPTSAALTPSTSVAAEAIDDDRPIGERVLGDRVLLIGDSVMASTAPRNDGLMCEALSLYGWDAEIDAEPGQPIEFADEVLDRQLTDDSDWDVVVLSFGSQVDGTDPVALGAFERDLDALFVRLEPRPVLVFTLAEVSPGREQINAMIRARPRFHPNAVVLEFADAGADGVPLVEDDLLTLTDDGMKRLSIRTAAALGNAPDDADGACLPSDFIDDTYAD